MRKKRVAAGVVAVVVAAGIAAYFVMSSVLEDPTPVGKPTPAPEGAGWVDLLDAAHAGGWENAADDKDIFEITEDGVLHIYGVSLYPLRYAAYTARSFGDFDLHLEFRVAGGANSGVFLRSTPNDPVQRGFEVQVLDDAGAPPNKNGSGAIYDVVSPMFNLARPAGQWNSYDIALRGREVKVTMNGWLVIHTDFARMTRPLGKFEVPYAELPLQGHLMLQDHGGEVWYRNIRIKPVQTGGPS